MSENSVFFVPMVQLEPWNPFHFTVWGNLESPITKEEIAQAVADKNTTAVPHKDFHIHTRQFHIQRIAHFVLYGWEDPIQIDVGVPNLGCHVSWIIIEGNHRLAAAFFLNHPTIRSEISGSWDHAETLLAIQLPKP